MYPYINPFAQQQAQQAFVSVRSAQEAMSYPVAPGNSIVFKDENQPYCYVKTMGFNQFDCPTFERYRLVKETAAVEAEYVAKSDLAVLRSELDSLKAEVDSLKERTEMQEKCDGNCTKKQKKWVEVDDD